MVELLSNLPDGGKHNSLFRSLDLAKLYCHELFELFVTNNQHL